MTHSEEITALQAIIPQLATAASHRQTLSRALTDAIAALNAAALAILTDAPQSGRNLGPVLSLEVVSTNQAAFRAVNAVGRTMSADKDLVMREIITRMDPALRQLLNIPNPYGGAIIIDLSVDEQNKWADLENQLTAIVDAG